MIKNIINQIKLYFLFKYFKKNKSLPKEIQIGKINSYFLVNFIENKISNNEFLNGNIYTGMSEDNCLAWLKAISELIERRAFLENKIISIERFSRASDGCAAFPTILIGKEIAKKRARKNAINEALERYVWGKWWDMKSASTINTLDISSKPMSVLKHLCNDIKIKNLFSIQPHFDSFQKRIVLILFLEIDNGGFLSGGACGEKDDYNSVFERAFVELIRHLLGYKRMLKSNLKPTTFYDKRIFFFASGAGRSLVHERIYSTNASIVHLPKIKYDSILGHKLQKIAVVYHFQFENPPLFLEGPLERLCI